MYEMAGHVIVKVWAWIKKFWSCDGKMMGVSIRVHVWRVNWMYLDLLYSRFSLSINCKRFVLLLWPFLIRGNDATVSDGFSVLSVMIAKSGD